MASTLAAVFWLAAIVVVHRRAEGHTERRYRVGVPVLSALLLLSALMNALSNSRWENFLFAPAALALAFLCLVVARAANRSPLGRTAAGRAVITSGTL